MAKQRSKKYKEARELKEDIQKEEAKEIEELQKAHLKQMDKLREAKQKKQKTEVDALRARLEKNINAKLKQRMEEYEKLLLKIQNYHNEMLNKQSREFGRIQTVHAKLLAKYGLNIGDVTERHQDVGSQVYRSSRKSGRSGRSKKSQRSGRSNRGNKHNSRKGEGESQTQIKEFVPGSGEELFDMDSGALKGDLVSQGAPSHVEEIPLPEAEIIKMEETQNDESQEEAVKEAQIRVHRESQNNPEDPNQLNVDVKHVPAQVDSKGSLPETNENGYLAVDQGEVKDPEDTEVYVDDNSQSFQSKSNKE